MARYESIGHPVNEGERLVLESLRDGLPDDWYLLGNFEIFDGRRSFEADAVIVAPHGWIYVVEVKQMDVVQGNNHTWLVRSFSGNGVIPFDSPYGVTQGKCRKLAGMLRRKIPASAPYVAPLIVIVSDMTPELNGAVASVSCLHTEAVDRALVDPRPNPVDADPGDGQRVFEALFEDARPLTPPSQLGPFRLAEPLGNGPLWTTWLAFNRLSPDEPLRLKYYTVDPLLDDVSREEALSRIVADARVLDRLQGRDGVLPIVASPFEIEGGVVVATRWPQGQAMWSHIRSGIDVARATQLFDRLVSVVAGLHERGITHRNLSPATVFVTAGDEVVVTDFDFARVAGRSGVTEAIDPEEFDPEFVAPEVIANPASTTAASDVWSLGKIGMHMFEQDGSPPEVAAILDGCVQNDPAARPRDAQEIRDAMRNAHQPPTVYGLASGDVLDDRFVIESNKFEGGHSFVFRAHDTRIDRDVALKFRRPESPLDLANEKNATAGLLGLQGLAVPEHLHRCSTWRSTGPNEPFTEECLIMGWMDGEPLSQHIADRMPADVCLRIAHGIAKAVAQLHSRGIVHQDLKPENVLLDSHSNPRVIDFNVSISLDDDPAMAMAGTPWYQPADAIFTGADTDVDVYAISGILLELITGRRLEGRFRETLSDLSDLPESLRELLECGLAERPNRPDDCTQLAGLLSDVIHREAQRRRKETPIPTQVISEVVVKNRNPTVTELVTRFSQSEVSNSGTRGLATFDHATYVETKLDSELTSVLLSAQSRLVIVTGNAGDGKTAFLQRAEALFAEGAVEHERLTNGSRIALPNLELTTNWDGSQDEGDQTNAAVLTSFFSPFSGSGPEPSSPANVRLIAVNEGRLLDFVREQRGGFPALAREVEGALLYNKQPDVEWLTIVNLNLRALTAGLSPSPSVVELTLQAFSDANLWQSCSECDFVADCPIAANSAVLADPNQGPVFASRVQRVMDVVRLRRQLHVTMRDLRSALAFAITGGRTCEDIERYIGAEGEVALVNLFLPNNLFAASNYETGHPSAGAAKSDRLLRLIGELDPARFSNPVDDARLWMSPPELASSTDRLAARISRPSTNRDSRASAGQIRLRHASLKRDTLLGTDDPDWMRFIPFRHLAEFQEQLLDPQALELGAILDAISRSDGFPVSRFPGVVGVRTGSGTGSRADTFITHSKSDFQLDIEAAGDLTAYIEYEPSSLILKHVDRESVRLVIDLELYESLMQVLRGNAPSREQRLGHWIELSVFKDLLRSLPARQTTLIDDDGRAFSIRRREGMIGVEIETVLA